MKEYVDIVYNSNDLNHLDNPYGVFDLLRPYGSLVPTFENQWLTTTYKMVKTVLLNPNFGRGDMYRVAPFEETFSPVEIMRKNWMLFCDPPQHTKLKRLSLEVLSYYINDQIKNKVKDISLYLIEKINTSEPFDLISSYAYPLPLLVIAELLGVPKEDRDMFKVWSAEVNKTLEPCCSLEQKRQSDEIVKNVYTYFHDLVQSNNIPDGSMLAMLRDFSLEGEKLTYDEMIYTAILLLIAGHETTSSMTGMGMLTLTKFPEMYKTIRNKPELIPESVEELIRYEPPVQLARRIALQECVFDDKNFKKGDMITVAFGAANYDPQIFENPYDFKIGRKRQHLSFGFGGHFCLGTKLALMEMDVVFNHLITHLPQLKLVTQKAEWKPNIVLRGLDTLILSAI